MWNINGVILSLNTESNLNKWVNKPVHTLEKHEFDMALPKKYPTVYFSRFVASILLLANK